MPWKRCFPIVYASIYCPSVVCPSVNAYFTWRALSVLSTSIKLATNIHHVSVHCWKGFQGQRWRSRPDLLTYIGKYTFNILEEMARLLTGENLNVEPSAIATCLHHIIVEVQLSFSQALVPKSSTCSTSDVLANGRNIHYRMALLWHFRDSGARYKTADLLTYLKVIFLDRTYNGCWGCPLMTMMMMMMFL